MKYNVVRINEFFKNIKHDTWPKFNIQYVLAITMSYCTLRSLMDSKPP